MEACLDLIGSGGVTSATIDAVCEQAGLTKRYFYESFTDRDELFTVVIGEMFDGVQADILQALEPADASVESRARATAGALVAALDRDRRKARLYVEAPAHPALHVRRDAAVGAFAQLLMTEVLRSDPDDPRSKVAALLIVAGTTEVVSRWLAGELDLDRDELVDEITRVGIATAT
ncbi:MAG: Transcriptional regulator, TetR [Aeromicrobium sp.]|nr:Transcriptional regulator, TetR [Aeromicrobium sp.]